jgi:hypothetical protein
MFVLFKLFVRVVARRKPPGDLRAGGLLSSERPQSRLDRRSPVLEEGRQVETFAKAFQWLIDGEARPVSGDLEQVSVRLTE